MPAFIHRGGKLYDAAGMLYDGGPGAGPGGSGGRRSAGGLRDCAGRQDHRTGRNRREEKQSTASHAEMEAIAQANAALGTWRLDTCELYVTLEPCPMCAGAILNARIRRVWYGARDEVMGPAAGVLNLFMEDFPEPARGRGGVLGRAVPGGFGRVFGQLRQQKDRNF